MSPKVKEVRSNDLRKAWPRHSCIRNVCGIGNPDSFPHSVCDAHFRDRKLGTGEVECLAWSHTWARIWTQVSLASKPVPDPLGLWQCTVNPLGQGSQSLDHGVVSVWGLFRNWAAPQAVGSPRASELHLPLPITPITAWVLPPVRSAAALDSHRSMNLTVNSKWEGYKLWIPCENLMPGDLRRCWDGDASTGEQLQMHISISRGLTAETIINQLFPDSYQNPLSEWQVTIKLHLVAGFKTESNAFSLHAAHSLCYLPFPSVPLSCIAHLFQSQFGKPTR